MNIFNALITKIKDIVLASNETGIPLPLLYDNHKDRGSYPLTMFFISFNIAVVTLIGKVTNYLGNVDYSNVLWLLGVTGTFWLTEALGRKITIDQNSKTINVGDVAKDDE